MQQMFPMGICVVGEKNYWIRKCLWRKMLKEYKILGVVRYHQLNKKSAKWTLSIGIWFMGETLWIRFCEAEDNWIRNCEAEDNWIRNCEADSFAYEFVNWGVFVEEQQLYNCTLL